MKNKLHCLYLLLALSSSAHAATPNLVVNLSASGTVAAASSLNVGLTGLLAGATYNVVCYVNSATPFQYIKLGSQLTDTTSTVLYYSLNGNYVSQDQLLVGQNLVLITGIFNHPTTDLLVLSNIDQNNPFTVSKCFAIPIQSGLY